MTEIYRIFPVLWNDGITKQAQTVYAIDRPTSLLQTACSSRVKEDPAYYWDSSSFQRLLPQEPSQQVNAVSWSTLPAWLSYAQSQGYTIKTDFTHLKPYSDVYISGP